MKKNRHFRDSFINELETVDEIPEFTKISNIFRKKIYYKKKFVKTNWKKLLMILQEIV